MITQVLAIFLTAICGGLLAWKFKQPLISGYLLASVVVAIFFGRILRPEANEAVGQLGLTLLLFSIGLEFSFRRLARVKAIAVLGAIIQIVITTAIFFFILNLVFGFLPASALVLAYAFSMASTAVVTKVLLEKGHMDTLKGEIATGWLMTQDLAVLPGLILIGQIGQIGLIWKDTGLAIVKSAVLLYLIVFLGKKILPKILDKAARINNRELFTLTIVAIILVSAMAANFAGLSLAIGAFIAGLIIAESAQNHTVFAEIRPLRDVFAVVFFVGIGLGTDLGYLANWTNLMNLIAVTLLIFLIKIIVSLVITIRFKYHLKTAMEVAFAVSGVGEFALVLGLAALARGIITPAENAFLTGVAIFSMSFSPFIINLGLPVFEKTKNLAGRWSPKLYKLLFSEFDTYRKERGEVVAYDHVITCGHGRVGKQISRILALAGIPYVVVDFNHLTISELSATGVETVLGDPADIDVLRFAGIAKAVMVVVAVPDRHSQELIISHALTLKPGIPIICRSHFDEDRGRLYAVGANYVIQPEMEAGLTMGHKLLDVLGFEKQTINAFVKQVRKEQER
ncbi:MAG: cation:proton antiporter [Patescibacteria group bacterium]